jgi:LysM repeat protein
LSAIAKRFGVSVAAIGAANHITNPDQVTEGEVLAIPPAPPAQLVVTPADATAGATFDLGLTGAKPSELVTFEIDSPGGGEFTGPPHTALPDGSVSASYLTTQGNAPGVYSVQAKGDHGTSARAGFRVDAATAPYSP